MGSVAKVKTNLGPVKPWVERAAEEIVTACPQQIWFWWGAPGRGTGDHAKGLALDLTTHDGGTVNNPGPLRNSVGDWVANYALKHRTRLGLTYVIWNRRIASEASSPDWSWRRYTGSNPHTDHVHMSFKSSHTYRPPVVVKPPTQDEEDAMTQAEFTTFLKVALDDPDVKRKVGDAVLARLYLEYPPGTGAGGERLQTTVAGAIFRADQMARIAAAQEQPSASQKQASASAPDPAD